MFRRDFVVHILANHINFKDLHRKLENNDEHVSLETLFERSEFVGKTSVRMVVFLISEKSKSLPKLYACLGN